MNPNNERSNNARPAVIGPSDSDGWGNILGIDWISLFQAARDSDSSASKRLDERLGSGLRLLIGRQLRGANVEKQVQDAIKAILAAIRSGELNHPEQLLGFAVRIAQRQTASAVTRVRIPELEKHTERVQLLKKTLATLPEQMAEILTRFYTLEQPAGRICADMGITESEFRLLKSKGKLNLMSALKIAGDLLRVSQQ